MMLKPLKSFQILGFTDLVFICSPSRRSIRPRSDVTIPFDNYLTSVRRVRNRCAHAGILFDYAATEALTTRGPVNLPALPDRTNLRGTVEVIKYLTSIVSANRLADLERELQQLIDNCKDDDALYTAIQIASGLK